MLWFGSNALHLFTLRGLVSESKLEEREHKLGSWNVLTQMVVSGHSSQTPEELLFHCMKEVEVNSITFSYIQSDLHLYLKLPGNTESAGCQHLNLGYVSLHSVFLGQSFQEHPRRVYHLLGSDIAANMITILALPRVTSQRMANSSHLLTMCQVLRGRTHLIPTTTECKSYYSHSHLKVRKLKPGELSKDTQLVSSRTRI